MRKSEHTPSIKYYLFISVFALLAVAAVLLIESSNNPSTEKRENKDENPPGMADAEQIAAIKDLQKALNEEPEKPELNIQMANMLFDIGRFEDAILYYRTALDRKPELIAAQIDLAICYYNLQITDTALVEIKKALKIDPHHIKGLFNIGVMYYNTGRINLAKKYWRELIELHPESPEAGVAKDILKTLNT